MRCADGRRRGGALLEVLIAMTILGIAGASMAVLATESGRLVRRAQDREVELRRADALFTSVALWTREDLDRHLGDHPQGPWRLTVMRPTSVLYDVALRDTIGMRLVLHTVLYRPAATGTGGQRATP